MMNLKEKYFVIYMKGLLIIWTPSGLQSKIQFKLTVHPSDGSPSSVFYNTIIPILFWTLVKDTN